MSRKPLHRQLFDRCLDLIDYRKELCTRLALAKKCQDNHMADTLIMCIQSVDNALSQVCTAHYCTKSVMAAYNGSQKFWELVRKHSQP